MPTDPKLDHSGGDEQWSGDFRAAENRLLDAALAATPSQRLKWVEDALAFATKVGAVQNEPA
jgi:hypothetical protein